MPPVPIQKAFEFAVQHHHAGRFPEAEAIYRQILAVAPRHADTLHLLGVLAAQAGRCDRAVPLLLQAIAVAPNRPTFHSAVGEVFRLVGRLDESLAACRRAIQLQPDFADAYLHLGNALKDHGDLTAALGAYRRVIELQPNSAVAHNNLANVLKDQGYLDDAALAYRQAIALQPDFAEAHNNLANVLKDQGHLEDALGMYRRAIELNPHFVGAHHNLLLALHYSPDSEPEAIFAAHCRWKNRFAEFPVQSVRPGGHDRTPGRRLRIGYVSPDFCDHIVGHFLSPVVEHHDHSGFEITCYSGVARPDGMTERFRNVVDRWRDTAGLSDDQLAELIRRDGIDILVDLAGHTAHNRLLVFARKPAPVQVTWLGYPDTTGLSVIDYRITDARADPPGTSVHLHSEQLFRLPDVFVGYQPVADAPPVQSLPALATGYVTFASFHTLAKLHGQLLDWWSRILLQVPGSRLLVVAAGLEESSQQERMRDYFGTKGIDPGRLKFQARQPLGNYLALHHEVDLLLDSYPFTGHTTSCHALCMGVPVVTLAGQTHCARMVASILSVVGLTDLIARTPDDYIRVAIDLAGDLSRLSKLRSTLRARMAASPLLDTPRFTRNLEDAFRRMWSEWCTKQPPTTPAKET